jgi:hypothetical protein
MWAIITNNFGEKNFFFENPGLYIHQGFFWGEKKLPRKKKKKMS